MAEQQVVIDAGRRASLTDAQGRRRSSVGPTPDNLCSFQGFEWYCETTPPPNDQLRGPDSHWQRLARILPSLAELGISSMWVPPGCKANEALGNGYDCYDLWDLGEFDQKGSRATRWGSREDLDDMMKVARECRPGGLDIIWDAILNHKTAGDGVDETWAVEVAEQDRMFENGAPKKIESWLKYDYPNRKQKYSSFQWRAEHFSGTEWDQRRKKTAIYKIIDDPATYPRLNSELLPMPCNHRHGYNRILRMMANSTSVRPPNADKKRRSGKGWSEYVDKTFGNYDYLLFSNIYFGHQDVVDEMVKWGRWMVQEVGIQGFRMDAAKHFSWEFARIWIDAMQEASFEKYGKGVFIASEIWTAAVPPLAKWLDDVTSPGAECLPYTYDVPLLYSFSRISQDVVKGNKNADLRTILNGPKMEPGFSVSSARPDQAVTFVTNHDTQPGQASQTPMDSELKTIFYGFILLRQEGYPTVFWGDLYGTKGPHAEPPACRVTLDPIDEGKTDNAHWEKRQRCVLPSLMMARKWFAYGPQKDYFDEMHCIGWTRGGTSDRPGCAVVLSIGGRQDWATRKMKVGKPGEKWVDILSEKSGRPETTIDQQGFGSFGCRGRRAAVFVRSDLAGVDKFPIELDHDVYRKPN